MPGTKAGAAKAAATNKAKYGENFYKEIGRKGGLNGHDGGFKAYPELAKLAGKKGGSISSRSLDGKKDLETRRKNYNKNHNELSQHLEFEKAKSKTPLKPKAPKVKAKTENDELIEDLREYEKKINEPVKVEKKGFFSRWFRR